MVARSSGEPVVVGRSEKMSKSRKNVVDPEGMIETYGADTARLFMLSDSPPDRDLEWTDAGIEGAWRFVNRLWRMVDVAVGNDAKTSARAGARVRRQCAGRELALASRHASDHRARHRRSREVRLQSRGRPDSRVHQHGRGVSLSRATSAPAARHEVADDDRSADRADHAASGRGIVARLGHTQPARRYKPGQWPIRRCSSSNASPWACR